ncbi:MAG: hypothetical protein OEM23_02575 [Gemmatimonadota bacterium]|nr:hypothetical protein [Gemmatimonadota bacterium]MDH3427296.1 hypothetical protein [Gemmatimonadota bacterium]
MNRIVILAGLTATAALGAAFAFGLFSSGDTEGSSGLLAADSPVVTVYKSPT